MTISEPSDLADGDSPEPLDDERDSSELWRSERLVNIALLLVLALLTLADLLEDHFEGVALWPHLALEALIFSICLTSVLFLWRRRLAFARQENYLLRSQMLNLRKDLASWKSESASILRGLGEAINDQFNTWGLSEAEKEVGLLLLKGFSHKEIAEVRNSAEKTVRHHAASVYRKADLTGRAQLSAFFLEDLLLPINHSAAATANNRDAGPKASDG